MFALFSARLKGFRTVLAFAPVLLLAVLDQLHAIDFGAFLGLLGVPEPSKAGVISALSLLALVLRLYSTTPIAKAAPPPADEPK